MTQLQKLALLNVVTLPIMVAVLTLGELKILSYTAELAALGLLLAAFMTVIALMTKMPWHKGTVDDERDRRFRARSFAAAYYVLMGSLSAGMVISAFVFAEGQVPMRFVAGWIGIAGIASVVGQSVALLVQYRRGLSGSF